MNAKQLIEAAERVNEEWNVNRISSEDLQALINHVMTTVRPDDDEPVTPERLKADGWTKSKYVTKWYITPREHLTIEVVEDGGDWFFKLGVDDVCIAKMRDIRRLVAALGE
jgi:hypothetical protein